jgi:hypothetical protein
LKKPLIPEEQYACSLAAPAPVLKSALQADEQRLQRRHFNILLYVIAAAQLLRLVTGRRSPAECYRFANHAI